MSRKRCKFCGNYEELTNGLCNSCWSNFGEAEYHRKQIAGLKSCVTRLKKKIGKLEKQLNPQATGE